MAGHKAARMWPLPGRPSTGTGGRGALFSQHPILQDLAGNKITDSIHPAPAAYGLLVLRMTWTYSVPPLRRTRLRLSGRTSGASAVPPSYRKLRGSPI